MVDPNSSLSNLNINDIDTLCYHYLNTLYSTTFEKRRSDKNICTTYGEILLPSIDKLLRIIKCSDDDVFVDYGSGLGKIVIHVFLKTAVKASYGIELSPELHQQAINAAKKLQCDLPEFYDGERKLGFFLGDFLETPVPNATIVVINATCFTPSLLTKLGKVLENTPSLHTVLSTRPINSLQRLTFNKTVRVECSWDTALCYIYGGRG
ncbi:class I SAM-dependent methyltransferase [Legionella fallonii]|uniref:Histone-lysine N-methyltransferase, H3 lysine-79 specific n=1 Tax=Legionella fallonii LLAP-10 TaxID=1212491 RepID=A0A098G5P9_9GAMM|nr:hypothetical protein [Legionella fallonii]CEG56820.1 protein of unknown function [Legionella fallonii LLAP-10]